MAEDMKAVEAELREAAASYAGCHLLKCTSDKCISYGRLRLAMFKYMQQKFERIALKRLGVPKHDRHASGEAMAEVAAELALVIGEMGLEHSMHGGHGANTPKAAEA